MMVVVVVARTNAEHRATTISDIVLCHRHRRAILVINVFRSCFCIDGLLLLETFFIFIVIFFFFLLFGFSDFSHIFPLYHSEIRTVEHHTTENKIKRKSRSVVDKARFSITTADWYGCCELRQRRNETVTHTNILCHIRMVFVGCRSNISYSSSFFFLALILLFLFFRLLLFMFGIIAAKHIFRVLLCIYQRNESARACYHRHTVVAMAKIWQR